MRYLTIGILLCAILAVTMTESHHLNLESLSISAKNLELKQVVFRFIYDLSLYIIPISLFHSFKDRNFFYALLFYWLTLDVVGYSGFIYGWEKHAFFSIFSLITLSYFAIQYKRNVNIVISFGIMVAFQLFMIVDWFNGDDQTILYTNYHYILTGIHLLTISTLIRWTALLRLRAYIVYYIGLLKCRFSFNFVL